MNLPKSRLTLQPFSQSPALSTDMEPIVHRIERTLTVPTTGGLTPNPAIRTRALACLNQRKSIKKQLFANFIDLFNIRIPAYQAAFGIAILLFAFFATGRPFDPVSSQPNTSQWQTAPTDPQHTGAGITLIDSLAQYRTGIADTFVTGTVDSL